MKMRKRKNAGKLLSRLLCLVTVMGMLDRVVLGVAVRDAEQHQKALPDFSVYHAVDRDRGMGNALTPHGVVGNAIPGGKPPGAGPQAARLLLHAWVQ